MSTHGILMSESDIDSGVYHYDSRKQKVTIDMNPELHHVDVLHLNGGTVPHDITTGGMNYVLVTSEILWRIPHNMPFKPRVEGFFYVTQPGVIPGGSHIGPSPLLVGSYYKDYIPIITNSMGYGEESVFMEVDDVYIYVKHEAYTWSTIEFYGVGNTCKFNFRYIVTNLPDITETVT